MITQKRSGGLQEFQSDKDTTARLPTLGMLFMVTAVTLVGCGTPDRRLVEDRQTCLAMGHAADTPAFKQCLEVLNDRRCPTEPTRHGERHVATKGCTQLPR